METVKEDIFISQELRYFDLTNIFFDAPILDNQIDELKEIFFSINSINQIYFRKKIDIKSIEIIKYLLELSPTMDDCRVEKYIIDTDDINLKDLSNITFINPSSWYISDELNKNKLISVDKYRELNVFINKVMKPIDDNKYSVIEKVALIYDYCKKLKLCDEEYFDVLDVLKTKKTNNLGLIKLFQLLLKKIDIKCFVGDSLIDGESSNVMLAKIQDQKYGIDGIYLFDPISDYVSISEVPDSNYRYINYNYFAIVLKDYCNTVFSNKLVGILNCLIHDMEYDLEKIRYISRIKINEIEESFNLSFLEIHKKVSNTKQIKDSVKLDIICSVNDKELNEVIKENYKIRKNKLLKYEIE